MLVLMDLEWTEHSNGEKELTQIAAIRIDEQWNKKEKTNLLICPAEGSGTDSVESYIARTGESALNEAIMKFATSARAYLR